MPAFAFLLTLAASTATHAAKWEERCLALEGRTVTLKEAARQLPSTRAECLVTLEPVGEERYRVTGAWRGGHSAIDVPDADKHLLDRAVTLHNHPGMTPEFSDNDLKMAVKYEAPTACISWRTGLGGRLSRQHVKCVDQDAALTELMERVTLEDLRREAALAQADR